MNKIRNDAPWSFPSTIASLDSLDISQAQLDQIIAENEDAWHDNIYALEKEYGGKLVTDKVFSKVLYGSLVRQSPIDQETGKRRWCDVLRPPGYPAEEFVCVGISFWVAVIGRHILRWYFIRRPRVFVIGGLH